MKKSVQKDIATSSTALVFLIVGTTGVMMYFHLFDGYTKKMHEVLGLVFVIAAVLHIFVNFKHMKQYFIKKMFLGILALTLGVVTYFLSTAQGGGVNPKRIAIDKVLKSPIDKTFVLFGEDMDEVKMRLENSGIKVNDEKNILQIAKANKTSPFKIIKILSK